MAANLRRQFNQRLDQKQDHLPAMPGLLGNLSGEVEAGTPNMVFVRVAQTVETAICMTVPHVYDLPVWVGYVAHMPDKLQVISQRILGGSNTDETHPGVAAHAASHEYGGEGAIGGTDVVKVHLQQFLPLRVFPISEMTIGIYPGIIWGSAGWAVVGETNVFGMPVPKMIDLLPELPVTADKSRFVLITIDDTGQVIKTAGAEVASSTIALSDIPTAPANTNVVLSAVRLYAGQTQITENRTGTDIIDLRFPMVHYHGTVIANWSDITGVPQAFFPVPHAGTHSWGSEYDEITEPLNPTAYPMLAGLYADRPAPGRSGVFWLATDKGILYRDNGTIWDIVSVKNFLDLNGLRASTNPGSPSAADLIYRSDVFHWALWTGSLWLSGAELSLGRVELVFSADGSGRIGKLRADRTPYITRISLLTNVATTNDATNYWTITIRGRDAALSAASNVHQVNTSAHTAGTFTESDGAPSITGSPADDALLDIAVAKTGAPGNLTIDVTVYYRYSL